MRQGPRVRPRPTGSGRMHASQSKLPPLPLTSVRRAVHPLATGEPSRTRMSSSKSRMVRLSRLLNTKVRRDPMTRNATLRSHARRCHSRGHGHGTHMGRWRSATSGGEAPHTPLCSPSSPFRVQDLELRDFFYRVRPFGYPSKKPYPALERTRTSESAATTKFGDAKAGKSG